MTRAHALARDTGAAFEAWVDVQHEFALRLGLLACVEHTRPPAIIRNGRMIYTAASVADWIGTLGRASSRPGVSLAVEAKSTTHGRLPRDRIAPLQAAHLDVVSRAGGLALLLVEFRSEKAALWTVTRFACPWLAVPWERARTAESVTAAALAGWEVAVPCYLARFALDSPRGPA